MEDIESGGETASVSADSNGISESGMAAINAKFAEVFSGDTEVAQNEVQQQADELAEAEKQELETPAVPAVVKKPIVPVVKTEATPATPAAEAPAKIDPLLRLAAIGAGYSEQEIDDLYAASPEIAEKTFGKVHDQYNDSTMRLLQAGQPGVVPPHVQTSHVPQNPSKSQLDALFNTEGLKAFREEHGDALVEKLLIPLQREILAPLRELHTHYEAQRQSALEAEVTTNLDGFSKDFPAVYGAQGVRLTQQQAKARQDVCNLADQIAAGAEVQGRKMSATEALKRAHGVFTSDHRAANERAKILAGVKKRSDALTSRPTNRQNPATATGAVKSESAAVAAYAKAAAALGHL